MSQQKSFIRILFLMFLDKIDFDFMWVILSLAINLFRLLLVFGFYRMEGRLIDQKLLLCFQKQIVFQNKTQEI